ncbi:YwaF family protein [Prauserella cavernicola]|uniref:YwaF family protein n=1 Tax=Prauserella cavernicola TaxID=2800127 RepID=UPI0027DE01CE|nr:TIGR02206 family membrane protein [Prauserella cavernicola]
MADREFTTYGLSHWLVLVVFAAGATVLVASGRRTRGTETERRVSRTFAVVVLASAVVSQSYSILVLTDPENWVPLQVSDLAAPVAAFALWTRRPWPCALTYFWCLTLSTQALLFPVLTGPDFPSRTFVTFWGLHLLVVWAAVYLTWGAGRTPDWQGYWFSITATAGWAAVAMVVNTVAGTNYGYLGRPPESASILDVLGPWPWYVLSIVALVLACWALMTWPWVRRSPVVRAAGAGS